MGIRLEVHGADASSYSPGLHLVDRAHLVPSISSGGYVDAVEGLVRREGIDLLVPLIDSELLPLSEARERLAELGCTVVISSRQVVHACRDKLETFRILQGRGIDTPRTWAWADVVHRKKHRFPYYLKPRAGSAALGNYVVHNLDELTTFGKTVEAPIVQEYVQGEEYTLDVYTGLDGVARCIVPRKRLEVRGGEVSKGVTVKNRKIMAVGRRVVEALGECRGVITVQCMLTPARRIRVIEVNPRFGGGAPLAIRAGADFPGWILEEYLGRRPLIRIDGFQANVAMLRFDDSVFVEKSSNIRFAPKSTLAGGPGSSKGRRR